MSVSFPKDLEVCEQTHEAIASAADGLLGASRTATSANNLVIFFQMSDDVFKTYMETLP